MIIRRCPGDDDLKAFAVAPSNTAVAEHLAGCAACREKLELISRDEDLLTELRQVHAEGTDRSGREHILALCVRAATGMSG